MKEFHYAPGFYSLDKNRKKKIKNTAHQIAKHFFIFFFNTTFNNSKSTLTPKSDPSGESSLQGEVWTQEGLYRSSRV